MRSGYCNGTARGRCVWTNGCVLTAATSTVCGTAHVVRAQHHTIGTDEIDQVLQRKRVPREIVVVEPAKVGMHRLFQPAAATAAIQTPDDVGKCAARMCNN